MTGCSESGQPSLSSSGLCSAQTVPIDQVQGSSWYSPLEDELLTVNGTVTRVHRGEGFFLEGATPHAGDASRAIFIVDESLSDVAQPGDRWAIRGIVTERGKDRDKLTSIHPVEDGKRCAVDQALPETVTRLPLDNREREALEGMRLAFEQPLTVTDVYNLSRGELYLRPGDVARIPTELQAPGRRAHEKGLRNREHSLAIMLPGGGSDAIPVGAGVAPVSGVMGHDGHNQQFFVEALAVGTLPEQEPAPMQPEGTVRIVDANLLNFFNGDGRGGGFPTERGARSPEAFEAQAARLSAGMAQLQPDLLAVQELENDGFGADSAASSLLQVLAGTGHEDWAVIESAEGSVGDDVIAVGLFYRQSVFEPVGESGILEAPEFEGLSRHPLAQAFRHRASGTVFLAVVNHLKSKGRCPEDGPDSNQFDGQGCWNAARTAAVRAQAPWLQRLAAEAGTEHVLILGDMNAYRQEDPISEFRRLGYIDLAESSAGLPLHSYLNWGQLGTLDYAFGSPSLAELTAQATIWNVNAQWPRRMEPPQAWQRFSDHDPVVVDLRFSQSSTED